MNVNVHAAMGAGRNRAPFRIKEALHAKGLRQIDVAQAVKVVPPAVSDTIWGRKNHRRVLSYLRDVVGVAEEYLGLPKDMQSED